VRNIRQRDMLRLLLEYRKSKVSNNISVLISIKNLGVCGVYPFDSRSIVFPWKEAEGVNVNGCSDLRIHLKRGPYPKIIFFFENMDLINKNRFQLPHTSLYIDIFNIYLYIKFIKIISCSFILSFIHTKLE
jgi:hypothetical protein